LALCWLDYLSRRSKARSTVEFARWSNLLVFFFAAVENTQASSTAPLLIYVPLLETAVFHRNSGGDTQPSDMSETKRLKPGIATTPNPCCILFTDDDDDPRALMNCQHGITAEAMTGYLESSLSQKGLSAVTCPMCYAPWDFNLCIRVANLKLDEQQRLEELVSRNYAEKYESQPYAVLLRILSTLQITMLAHKVAFSHQVPCTPTKRRKAHHHSLCTCTQRNGHLLLPYLPVRLLSQRLRQEARRHARIVPPVSTKTRIRGKAVLLHMPSGMEQPLQLQRVRQPMWRRCAEPQDPG